MTKDEALGILMEAIYKFSGWSGVDISEYEQNYGVSIGEACETLGKESKNE